MCGISRPVSLLCIAHRLSESDGVAFARCTASGAGYAARIRTQQHRSDRGSAWQARGTLAVESMHAALADRNCGVHRCAGSGRRRRASCAPPPPRYMGSLFGYGFMSSDDPSVNQVRFRGISRAVSIRDSLIDNIGASLVKYRSALDLPIPRNLTALLQHLQRLVGIEGHLRYCTGYCPLPKLGTFIDKMAARYPLTRSTRERAYDRKRGLAAVHLIVYPAGGLRGSPSRRSGVFALGDASHWNEKIVEELRRRVDTAQVAWWIVSSDGVGGLTDPEAPDVRVAKDAMLAESHITYEDYVLLYAHKRSPRKIIDGRSERTKTIYKDESTWTWKMRGDVCRELRALIDECCTDLDFGSEPSAAGAGRGLQGLLHAQRSRPLFSGVRTQVLELEKYARDEWARRAPLWRATHPHIAAQLGGAAGELKSMRELLTAYLPKMVRHPVYEEPPLRIRDLLRSLD
jgi:hypothetical protein